MVPVLEPHTQSVPDSAGRPSSAGQCCQESRGWVGIIYEGTCQSDLGGVTPPPQSYTTQSLTPRESARISTPLPRHLTPQQGMSSTGWGDSESSG